MGSRSLIELTDDTFDDRVSRTEVPILVDFWASWCPPCKTILPDLETIAGWFDGKLIVARVNVEECDLLGHRFGIRSVPTLLLIDRGRVVDQKVGAVPLEQIRKFVETHLD